MTARSRALGAVGLMLAIAAAAGCGPKGDLSGPADVPVLVSPPPGAVLDNGCVGGTDPREWSFDWSDVAGADLYHLVVYRSRMAAAVDRADLTTSEYVERDAAWILDGDLDEWWWRVRARTSGVWGEWSERPFVVEPVGTDCR